MHAWMDALEQLKGHAILGALLAAVLALGWLYLAAHNRAGKTRGWARVVLSLVANLILVPGVVAAAPLLLLFENALAVIGLVVLLALVALGYLSGHDPAVMGPVLLATWIGMAVAASARELREWADRDAKRPEIPRFNAASAPRRPRTKASRKQNRATRS